MDETALIARLEAFPAVLRAVTAALPTEEARRRPAEGKWSVLEVLGHLIDEETHDFRVRTRSTLEDPERPWPAFDPEGTVAARNWNDGHDARELVERFADERSASVAWLHSLRSPDWKRARKHPRIGNVHAGDLLGAWVAHDVRHLQQIARNLYGCVEALSAPYSVAYAG
jgi:hypothetical protein